MSSNYKGKDGFFTISPKENPAFIRAIAEGIFDEQVDYDVMNIEEEIRITEILKKTCLVKILIYPIEWLFTKLLVGGDSAIILTAQLKVYYSFYVGKISLTQFKGMLFI